MKKLFAVLVALTLVLSMGVMAFAADTGTITITNAEAGAKYDFYRIFDLVSYDADNNRYSYKLSEKWAGFKADAYFTINADGYVEFEEGIADNSDEINAFVELALAYAETLEEDATQTPATTGSMTVTGLPLGYYLVDTALGTLCSITTTKPNAEITDKNQKPDIKKEVQEDADSSWGEVNDADIGQDVFYKSTVTVGLGATNYIMHDTMTESLTFNNDVKVYVGGVEVAAEGNYVVKTTGLDDGCTFEVEFDDAFIADLAMGDTIEVTYSAVLNEKAIVGSALVDGKGNDNTVELTYGENSEFEAGPDTTRTFTWEMDVLKYTDTVATPLAGAQFMLLKTEGDEDTAIKFTAVAGAAVPTYKVDPAGTVTVIETDATGEFAIIGLDEGQYYLHEKEAPVGYNKLANDLDVVITSTHNDAGLSATYEINGDDPATIEVENKTGSLLPETGGIGTTIFYVVGGLMMVAAVVFLVSKKRMASFA